MWISKYDNMHITKLKAIFIFLDLNFFIHQVIPEEYAGYQRHSNGYPTWAGPHYTVASLNECIEDCSSNVYCLATFYRMSDTHCYHLVSYNIDQWNSNSDFITYIKDSNGDTLPYLVLTNGYCQYVGDQYSVSHMPQCINDCDQLATCVGIVYSNQDCIKLTSCNMQSWTDSGYMFTLRKASKVFCPILEFLNGQIEYSNSNASSSVATLTCNVEDITVTVESTCQSDNTWSDASPICNEYAGYQRHTNGHPSWAGPHYIVSSIYECMEDCTLNVYCLGTFYNIPDKRCYNLLSYNIDQWHTNSDFITYVKDSNSDTLPYLVLTNGYCQYVGDQYSVSHMPQCINDCDQLATCVGIVYSNQDCIRLTSCNMQSWTASGYMFTLRKASKVFCPILEFLNGQIEYSNSNASSSVATLTCNVEDITVTVESTCQSDNTWSDASPICNEYAGYQRHTNGHPSWAGPHYIVSSIYECMEDCTLNVYCLGTFYNIPDKRCYNLLSYNIDQWHTNSDFITYVKDSNSDTLPYLVLTNGYCQYVGDQYSVSHMPQCINDCDQLATCVGIVYSNQDCIRLTSCNMQSWTASGYMFTLRKASKVFCPILEFLNGQIEYSNSNASSSVATLTCNVEDITVTVESTCQSDNTWSDASPICNEYAGYQRHTNGHPSWAGPHYIVSSIYECMEDCTLNVYCLGTFYNIPDKRCYNLLSYNIDQWNTNSDFITYVKEMENVIYPYSVHVKGYCAYQGVEYAILNMPTCVQDCNEDIECVGIMYKHLVCFRLRNCDMEGWTSQNDIFTLLKETCSAIPAIENGYVVYTDEELPRGTTASYACDNGYLPSSFVNRTCTNAKTWSDITEPTCYVPDVISWSRTLMRQRNLLTDGNNYTCVKEDARPMKIDLQAEMSEFTFILIGEELQCSAHVLIFAGQANTVTNNDIVSGSYQLCRLLEAVLDGDKDVCQYHCSCVKYPCTTVVIANFTPYKWLALCEIMFFV